MNKFLNGEQFQIGGIHLASSMYLADTVELGRFDYGRLATLEREWKAEFKKLPANDLQFSFSDAARTYKGKNGHLIFMYSPTADSYVLLGFELKPATWGEGNVAAIDAGTSFTPRPFVTGREIAAYSSTGSYIATLEYLSAANPHAVERGDDIRTLLNEAIEATNRNRALSDRQAWILNLIAQKFRSDNYKDDLQLQSELANYYRTKISERDGARNTRLTVGIMALIFGALLLLFRSFDQASSLAGWVGVLLAGGSVSYVIASIALHNRPMHPYLNFRIIGRPIVERAQGLFRNWHRIIGA